MPSLAPSTLLSKQQTNTQQTERSERLILIVSSSCVCVLDAAASDAVALQRTTYALGNIGGPLTLPSFQCFSVNRFNSLVWYIVVCMHSVLLVCMEYLVHRCKNDTKTQKTRRSIVENTTLKQPLHAAYTQRKEDNRK